MRNFISNFKFSKNIKSNFLIKISISKSFYISICAQSPFTTLDKILAPTIRRKINATLLTIPSFFVLIPIQKKKGKKRSLSFLIRDAIHPCTEVEIAVFFRGGEGKSDDIPKGRIFARRELLSTRYYASRRYNPLEAYAGQACPRPSFARSFTVVHVFMHFHPTTAS